MNIRKAYYIKLGKGGEWEKDSIALNIMRIGWPNNSLDDINGKNWETIRLQLGEEISHRGTATSAYHSLLDIAESNEGDWRPVLSMETKSRSFGVRWLRGEILT
jgi:hypothetical protein